MAERNQGRRTRVIAPVDLTTDMSNLLELAGVDGVRKDHLDRVLHGGVEPQALLNFASDMHLRTGRRIGYVDLIAAFMNGEES